MPTKDQSGVRKSGEWLKSRGLARYQSHESGGSLAVRKTRPITRERYDEVVAAGVCPTCSTALSRRTNPAGGIFVSCATEDCYYCGFREDEDRGEERINPYQRDVTAELAR